MKIIIIFIIGTLTGAFLNYGLMEPPQIILNSYSIVSNSEFYCIGLKIKDNAENINITSNLFVFNYYCPGFLRIKLK